MSLISVVPASMADSVDCELLELAVPSLPCTWCTCFSLSMLSVCSFVTPFSAVLTPHLELLALGFFFALSFALAFSFPFLLFLALALTFALDPADSRRRRTVSCRA